MTVSLDYAVVYDCETLPNCFLLNAQGLFTDLDVTFELSHYRDDRRELLAWFAFWQEHNIPMLGFNSLGFDYPVVHAIWQNPYISVEEIYDHAMSIINSFSRFGHQVWQSERFAPQCDLFKIHHMDNPAKATSLKALQFNMRSESVMEMPIPFGIPLTKKQIQNVLVPYCKHDVSETKKFALISMDAIKFRIQLSETLKGDVLNFPDTKIGAKLLEQRLGEDLCYTREYGSKQPRQTIRESIRLDDIIFPYIQFQHPEFNRVLSWMRTQTLKSDEFSESTNIVTKGVFKGVHAHVGGMDFHFGTGGVHGSVESQRLYSDDHFIIEDIDVKALYPSIGVVNRLYPEHLGERFVEEYAKLPIERETHKKGTVENSTLKLASNGTFGNSLSPFGCFRDARFGMTITINGQLMLCMLAEALQIVPTLQIIQINTDGITYRVHRTLQPWARDIQKQWEKFTCLVLESVEYKRMWIADVNNYVAESTDGKLKQKGRFWFPRKFPEDISNSSPPAWHKDFSGMVTIMAAVEHMVTGADIERFIYSHTNPFDFMCRAKVDRSSRLMIGDQEVQRICRYYVAREGGAMKKVSPPVKGAVVGQYKRRNGISDWEYETIRQQVGEGWDERIHTKNKSRYEIREMGIEAGHLVSECNVASKFDFQNVNYEWYIERAQKLVIG